MENINEIRNVAIIAHVDHGKTTLIDEILKQSSFFRKNEDIRECFLDSNDLERERGITILSKNISVEYKNAKINVIDTPGHCDFGGQVERVLKMADGVLLLVDAAEGPMPQTRFVLDKALSLNLKPIVIINKIDKPDARPEEVHDEVLELFFDLDATEEQCNFPILYASAKDGWASEEPGDKSMGIIPIMDSIIDNIPAPENKKWPVQAQINTLDYSEYMGRIGIGRVFRGTLNIKKPVLIIKNNGEKKSIQAKELFVFDGLERKTVQEVRCGDIFGIVGVEGIDIGDTVCDAESPEKLAPIDLDEPTISMIFKVNDSPLYGREGKYISSRHIRERLLREEEKDAALKVRELGESEFELSGRGVLHLSILLESMRRELYEVSVSKPQVLFHTNEHGEKEEPIEYLRIDCPIGSEGKIIEIAGMRKGEMVSMEGKGERQTLEFHIPTRGMIGLRSDIMTASAGEAIVNHRFIKYQKAKGEIPHRKNGVLVSMSEGAAVAYAIDALQQRGKFFVSPNEYVYEGMIVAEHCKEGDLVVNLQKSKKLTNVRAAGSDRAMKIAPAEKMSLEETLEYIEDDELVEITPENIRMRKKILKEKERKRAK